MAAILRSASLRTQSLVPSECLSTSRQSPVDTALKNYAKTLTLRPEPPVARCGHDPPKRTPGDDHGCSCPQATPDLRPQALAVACAPSCHGLSSQCGVRGDPGRIGHRCARWCGIQRSSFPPWPLLVARQPIWTIKGQRLLQSWSYIELGDMTGLTFTCPLLDSSRIEFHDTLHSPVDANSDCT